MSRLEQVIKSKLSQSTSLEGVDTEGLWNSISAAPYSTAASHRKRKFAFLWVLGALFIMGSAALTLSCFPIEETAYSPRVESDSWNTHFNYKQNITEEHSNNKSELTHAFNSFTEKNGDFNQNNNVDDRLITHNELMTNYNMSARNDSQNSSHEYHNSTGIKNVTHQNSDLESELLTYIQTDSKLKSKQAKASSYKETHASSNFQGDKNTSEGYSREKQEDIATFRKAEENRNQIDKQFELQVNTGENLKTIATLNKPTLEDTNHSNKQAELKKINLKRSVLPKLILSHQMGSSISIPKTKKSRTYSIYSGTAMVKNNLSTSESSFEESFNSSISSELGFRLGGALQLKQGKNWSLSSGLEFSAWNERLDKVLITDTLVTSNNNQLIPAINFRTIKHHNKVSVLTVPVELAFIKDTERMRFSLGLGASYSFVFGQEGRVLADEISVIDYSQSNKRYTNFIGARITPSVGFKLSDKIMLNGLYTLSFQGHGNSSFSNFKSNSVAFMPSIGLSFNY